MAALAKTFLTFPNTLGYVVTEVSGSIKLFSRKGREGNPIRGFSANGGEKRRRREWHCDFLLLPWGSNPTKSSYTRSSKFPWNIISNHFVEVVTPDQALGLPCVLHSLPPPPKYICSCDSPYPHINFWAE